MILEGMYLNSETAKEGELIKFEDEGAESTIKTNQGKDEKVVINFNVTRVSDGKALIYTPNWGAIKVFKQAWGNDTRAWVGKLFKCNIIMMLVAGNKVKVIDPVPFAQDESVQ